MSAAPAAVGLLPPTDPLEDQVNAMRAAAGLPPLPPGTVARVTGEQENPARNFGAPNVPAAGAGGAHVPAPAAAAPPSAAAPAPATGAAPIAPQPQLAPQLADPLDPILGQLGQFFDPGADQADLKKIPPVEVTSSFGSEEFSDVSSPFSRPLGGASPNIFNRGAGPGINAAKTGRELADRSESIAPRRTFTVKIGNQTVGRFRTEEVANAVRDRLRNKLKQGPAPSIPRTGLGTGRVGVQSRRGFGVDQDIELALLNRFGPRGAPRDRAPARGGAGGGGRRGGDGLPAPERVPVGVRTDLKGRSRRPEDIRLLNTVMQDLQGGPTRGPTLSENLKDEERIAAIEAAAQRGGIDDDLRFRLHDPSVGPGPISFEDKLRIASERKGVTPPGRETRFGPRGERFEVARSAAAFGREREREDTELRNINDLILSRGATAQRAIDASSRADAAAERAETNLDDIIEDRKLRRDISSRRLDQRQTLAENKAKNTALRGSLKQALAPLDAELQKLARIATEQRRVEQELGLESVSREAIEGDMEARITSKRRIPGATTQPSAASADVEARIRRALQKRANLIAKFARATLPENGISQQDMSLLFTESFNE